MLPHGARFSIRSLKAIWISTLMPVRFATTSAQNTAYAADDVTNEIKRRAGQTQAGTESRAPSLPERAGSASSRPNSSSEFELVLEQVSQNATTRRENRTAITGHPEAQSRSIYISTLSGRINNGAMRAGRPRSQGKQSVVSSQPKAAKGETREARGPHQHPSSGLPATSTTPGQSDSRTL